MADIRKFGPFYYSFMRVRSPGLPWIMTLGVGPLQVRIGNYQRAVWWLSRNREPRELYNSWKRNNA